ncbi:MAG: anaerobic ribonucleotide reductase small subunit [Wendovervirus sonii]|uniref:Anaerobic ribonucleotide reductase small subunit n=1 Tax=phage Lak_Megaphage_Sonny TaxID=3109229 RepID=A0ABZ0Z298_9CAUD|nr:MAG: anaerobic ribonucleotide reductase small subunit [phage Lak_Megaphage_Sonny]
MNILTLTTPNMENGLGCRVTMWVSGCSHHCEGCHNKHTWDYGQGHMLNDNIVKEKIFKALDHDYIQGLTISGGDPLDQTDESLIELTNFIKEYKNKFPKKDIWIYSGSIYEKLTSSQKEVVALCDVMVDGPFIQNKKELDLAFRGSSNQRIIDLNETRKCNEIKLINL